MHDRQAINNRVSFAVFLSGVPRTETGNPELIDSPIFIIAAKFTYYSVNYAAVGKSISENGSSSRPHEADPLGPLSRVINLKT